MDVVVNFVPETYLLKKSIKEIKVVVHSHIQLYKISAPEENIVKPFFWAAPAWFTRWVRCSTP